MFSGLSDYARNMPVPQAAPKPHIVKKNGRWLCDDIAYGDTPLQAYRNTMLFSQLASQWIWR